MVTPNVVEITDLLSLRGEWEQAQLEAQQARERWLAEPSEDARAEYRTARWRADATHTALVKLATAECQAVRRP